MKLEEIEFSYCNHCEDGPCLMAYQKNIRECLDNLCGLHRDMELEVVKIKILGKR